MQDLPLWPYCSTFTSTYQERAASFWNPEGWESPVSLPCTCSIRNRTHSIELLRLEDGLCSHCDLTQPRVNVSMPFFTVAPLPSLVLLSHSELSVQLLYKCIWKSRRCQVFICWDSKAAASKIVPLENSEAAVTGNSSVWTFATGTVVPSLEAVEKRDQKYTL